MTDKAEQFEELLSRRLDGDLTAEETARLDLAIAEDPQMKATAEQYDRLNQLIRAYRRLPKDVDWGSFFRNVTRRIDANRSTRTPAEADQDLDDSLENWAKPLPDVDWGAFKARVSAAVRQEAVSTRATTTQWPVAIRWFAPLAAAAAIAVAVWWYPWAGTGVSNPGASTVLVSLDMPVESGPISISFDESAVATETPEPLESSSAIAVGPRRFEAVDTFDEAYFY